MVKGDIDFVLTWVDDKDPLWLEKKCQYTDSSQIEGNTNVRYRDWDTLRYWFRGVEKFAPWVHRIYFVTDNQVPEWLNLDHPKLKWVNHEDFIPEEYLPTFNSHTIEWNLHRIEDLSEQFVYFNDDVFLIRDVSPEDFFVDGLPCDHPGLDYGTPHELWSYIPFNNTVLINRHFHFKDSFRKNPWKWIKHQSALELIKLFYFGKNRFISGVNAQHIHFSYRKEMFDLLWEEEYDLIHNTCKHRVRTKDDISHWCVRDWQLMLGRFYPQKKMGRMFATRQVPDKKGPIAFIKKQKSKVICINDTEQEDKFEEHKQIICATFEALLPQKSRFER